MTTRSKILAVAIAVVLWANAPTWAQRVDGSSTVEIAGKKPLWFRGTQFFFDQSISGETLNPNATLSYIPSYQWWMSFRPRFYLRPNLSLRVRFDLTVEFLNAVETRYVRQVQQGDLWTDLVYTPPKFAGIDSLVGLRAIWGTSMTSLAQQSVVRLGATLGIGRNFTTKAGTVDLRSSIFGTYNFALNTSSSVAEPYPCTSTDSAAVECTQGTGIMNPQFTLLWSLSASYNPIPKLGFGGTFIVIDSILYPLGMLPPLTDPQAGTVMVDPGVDPSRQRISTWILFNIDYEVHPTTVLSLGYYSFRNVLDPNGQYGNPFYAPGGGSRIFLTATFAIDRIYESAVEKLRQRRAQARAKSGALNLATSSTPSSTTMTRP